MLNLPKNVLQEEVPALGSVVRSLPTDEEVPVSIPSSVMGFSPNGELFHGMYGLLFLCSNALCPCLLCAVFGIDLWILLTTGQRRSSILPIQDKRNRLHRKK